MADGPAFIPQVTFPDGSAQTAGAATPAAPTSQGSRGGSRVIHRSEIPVPASQAQAQAAPAPVPEGVRTPEQVVADAQAARQAELASQTYGTPTSNVAAWLRPKAEELQRQAQQADGNDPAADAAGGDNAALTALIQQNQQLIQQLQIQQRQPAPAPAPGQTPRAPAPAPQTPAFDAQAFAEKHGMDAASAQMVGDLANTFQSQIQAVAADRDSARAEVQGLRRDINTYLHNQTKTSQVESAMARINMPAHLRPYVEGHVARGMDALAAVNQVASDVYMGAVATQATQQPQAPAATPGYPAPGQPAVLPPGYTPPANVGGPPSPIFAGHQMAAAPAVPQSPQQALLRDATSTPITGMDEEQAAAMLLGLAQVHGLAAN